MDSNVPSPPLSSGGSSSSAAVNGVSPSPAALAAAGPPPFLSKTYEMVDDPATDAIVSWGAGNNSFVVWNTPEFARDLLPKYFKHNNFSSFVRQLNTYGFRKIDPDRWEFANEGFLRGQKHLLKTINRRKSSHSHNHSSGAHIHQNPNNHHHHHNQTTPQNPSLASCVEVGKFGLEEEIERLKRDKNVLMQELVRLRQQQQSTDHQLQTLGKRLQGMEQRQQQMMSFLAKAMQSPGFLAQFMHQNDPNRRIVASTNKKRRLPKQGVSDPTNPNPNFTENGQIIKYQPLINEAAKAMLMKIMNMDSSCASPNPNSSSGFLLENSTFEPNPNPNPNRSSGVTLAEVPTASSAFSAVCSASAGTNPPEIQSPVKNPNLLNPNPNLASDMDTNVVGNLAEFANLQDIDNGFAMPDPDPFLNPIMEDSDEAVPIDTDELMYGDDEQKLPGIIDSFWEQFLNSSPISGETDEIESNNNNGNINGDNFNNNGENLENLTEQMGLLSSDPKA